MGYSNDGFLKDIQNLLAKRPEETHILFLKFFHDLSDPPKTKSENTSKTISKKALKNESQKNVEKKSKYNNDVIITRMKNTFINFVERSGEFKTDSAKDNPYLFIAVNFGLLMLKDSIGIIEEKIIKFHDYFRFAFAYIKYTEKDDPLQWKNFNRNLKHLMKNARDPKVKEIFDFEDKSLKLLKEKYDQISKIVPDIFTEDDIYIDIPNGMEKEDNDTLLKKIAELVDNIKFRYAKGGILYFNGGQFSRWTNKNGGFSAFCWQNKFKLLTID